MRISDEYLVYAEDALTAREIWAKLATIFCGRDLLNVLNLQCDFFKMFAEEGANMEEHTRKLQQMYLSLLARGEYITEQDFCNMLLTSLPKSWRMFITVTHTLILNMMSDMLISKIIKEDKMNQDTHEMALMGKEKKN